MLEPKITTLSHFKTHGKHFILRILLGCLSLTNLCVAESWPQFRGLRGDGTSNAT